MRIGIAIEYFDPSSGGAERSTDQIATELARRGHELVILAGAAPTDVDRAQLELRRWRSRKPRSGADARRFSRWAADQLFAGDLGSGLSVTTAVPAPVVQPRAGLVAENVRRSLVATPAHVRPLRRAGHILSLRKRSLLKLERDTLLDRRVRRFVAISQYMKQQLLDSGVGASRISVIPNAAEQRSIRGADREEARSRLREELSVQDDQPLLLFPSRDPRRKGLTPLLHTLARVREPTLLVIAGVWPDWGATLAKKLSIQDRIRPLGQVEEMWRVYAAVDLTVLPTYYDPASKVIIESLMLGTPALTTRYNGSADWIERCEDPRAGRVLDDPDDIQAMAHGIDELLEFRGSMATQPLMVDADMMSMHQHVDQLEELLAEASR